MWFDSPEVKRYIRVEFKQRRENWYKFKPGSKDFITVDEYEAKLCDINDFFHYYKDQEVAE